jgi:hypothetical protein
MLQSFGQIGCAKLTEKTERHVHFTPFSKSNASTHFIQHQHGTLLYMVHYCTWVPLHYIFHNNVYYPTSIRN